ncbi:glycoside hydrolase [Catenovulum adriaticum]|uniref:Glycoside hydrolase n=1 Tax=Catenovulum adriaticum TaxID=2984846 RepID=A0ABY7ALG5_9ALTE|nr:glycoside hydrolase [Catenovulum sp. TS8]WAJ70400.1 glycoside hydrolase [Catenovulum sp. TS8]
MLIKRISRRVYAQLCRVWRFHYRAAIPKTVEVKLEKINPVAQIEPEYLSFSLDTSVLVGGYWWEGSQGVKKGLGTLRVSPIDLTAKKLNRLVKALGPSYLRVGGSEADKIHYFSRPAQQPDALVLTTEMWDHLHQFVQQNQLKLIFTFKYGLFERSQHGNWQGSEIKALLDYSTQQGYQIEVCELGNELNAYWAFHGFRAQPSGQNLALDYAAFATLVKGYFPNIKVMGPGSAYWPKLGESLKPLPNLSQQFLANLSFKLDILSWHYYPFQSTRSPVRTRTATLRALLSPKSFKDFQQYTDKLNTWRDTYQPQAELWTGETGSAQCGGQPELSDRFVSCFWWAEQLGRGAVSGHKVMIRQSLIGGDYGLISRVTLKPRPDYWVSWLWNQLMGEQVFEISSSDSRIRAYCHQTPDKSGKSKTLLLINLASLRVDINLTGFGKIQQAYALTAKKIDAKKVMINGQIVKFKKGNIALNDFPQLPLEPSLAPFSINFWLVESIE